MFNLISLLVSPHVKGVVSLASAALMMVAPEETDHIVEGLLGAFGVSKLIEGCNGEGK